MNLFKRKTQSEIDSESLSRLLDECRERVQVLQQVSSFWILSDDRKIISGKKKPNS